MLAKDLSCRREQLSIQGPASAWCHYLVPLADVRLVEGAWSPLNPWQRSARREARTRAKDPFRAALSGPLLESNAQIGKVLVTL